MAAQAAVGIGTTAAETVVERRERAEESVIPV
jgi:hypothetical protein